MLKKTLFLSFILLNCFAFASEKIQVQALNDFSSTSNDMNLKVKLIENATLDDIELRKNDLIYCYLNKKTEPKRLKKDAKLYFDLISYENKNGLQKFETEYEGKYLEKSFKDKVDEVEGKDVAKKTAGTLGGIFLPITTKAVYFTDGVRKNEENNKIKSGFKEVYENSIFTYVEKGEEVTIQQGDIFYLIVK